MPKKKENLSPEEILVKAVIPKEEEPYKVPDNWVWTTWEKISDIFSSKRVLQKDWKKEGIPFYRTREIVSLAKNELFSNELFISQEHYDSLSKETRMPKAGDLMVTGIGTIGICYLVKESDCFYYKDASVLCVSKKGDICSEYLKYLMKTPFMISQIKKNSAGTTVDSLTINKYKTYKLPLSPFYEQKRIVEKLDSLFEKTGKIKEIIEEVKEKTSLRREAVLSKAFTGELTEKWRAENKTENAKGLLLKINEEKLKNNPKAKIKDISEMLVNEEEVPYKVPENWVWTRLEDIFRVERGGSPRPIKDFLVDSIDGINWIKIGDTELGKKYINSTKEKIKKEGIKKSRYVKKGDLLLTNSMSFGRAYILNCDGCIHDGWLVLQPEFDKISREYFYYLLNSRYMYLVFSELAKGSTVKNLNKDIVKTVAISLPPIEEQKEIVRILDKVFEEENKISELISLEEKVEILEKTILDKAFRGELGTGNTDDEPALELLKKVVGN